MALVRFHRSEFAKLTRTPEVKRKVRRTAVRVQTDARGGAPKDTGAGARSIRLEPTYDRATGERGLRVGWDRAHFYLWFYNNGANFASGRRIRAKHFMEDAARRNQR